MVDNSAPHAGACTSWQMKLPHFHGHLGCGIVAITRAGSMKRSRKPYPAEFKQEAVRLLREQRLPRSQVARDLGIDPETLRRWARNLSPDTAAARDTATTPPVSAAELARLRRENEQLRMERDILKKAIGIFSPLPE